MSARSTRQEAWARILAAFSAQLGRMIPEDEEVPLKGAPFAGFGAVDLGPAGTLALPGRPMSKVLDTRPAYRMAA